MLFHFAAGVRLRERHPPPVAIGRVRRCDRFAPSQLALSIAPRDSYNTLRKPRDGSGTVPPAALRTPPLRRRSANPLKYQWLSLPVAWTTRKHIDDAGGRDYLTPNAAGCTNRRHLPSTTPERPPNHAQIRPSLTESSPGVPGKVRRILRRLRIAKHLFNKFNDLRFTHRSRRYQICSRPPIAALNPARR